VLPVVSTTQSISSVRRQLILSRTASTPSPMHIHQDLLCADGKQPFVDQDAHIVRICNPFLHYTCPPDYHCQYNEHAQRYQCCQSPNEVIAPTQRQACPIGMRPFAHPRTHQPIVCQPGADGFCPYASLCQYSSVYWQFICCQPDSQRRNTALLTNDAVNEQGVGTDFPDTSTDQQQLFTAFVSPAVGLFDEHAPARSTVPQLIYPGEPGCHNDEQCSLTYPGAHCHDWVCACPIHMFVFERSCYFDCPSGTAPRAWRCIAL